MQNVFSKQCQAIIQEPRGLKRPREVCAGGKVGGKGVGSEESPGVLVASLQQLPTKGEGAALGQSVGLLLSPHIPPRLCGHRQRKMGDQPPLGCKCPSVILGRN